MNRVAQHVKEYWPLWGIVVAVATALTTYLGLPKRVEQVEAGQQTLEETFSGYLQAQQEALAEQRGYQKALNERVLEQPGPTQAIRIERDRPPVLWWQDAEGDWWCCSPRFDCDLAESWWRCD